MILLVEPWRTPGPVVTRKPELPVQVATDPGGPGQVTVIQLERGENFRLDFRKLDSRYLN